MAKKGDAMDKKGDDWITERRDGKDLISIETELSRQVMQRKCIGSQRK